MNFCADLSYAVNDLKYRMIDQFKGEADAWCRMEDKNKLLISKIDQLEEFLMKISAISLETSRSDRAKRNTCILTRYPTGLVFGQWDCTPTKEKSTQIETVSLAQKPEKQTTYLEHSYAEVKSNTSSISSAYYSSVNAVKIYASVPFVSRLYNDVAVQTENSELRDRKPTSGQIRESVHSELEVRISSSTAKRHLRWLAEARSATDTEGDPDTVTDSTTAGLGLRLQCDTSPNNNDTAEIQTSSSTKVENVAETRYAYLSQQLSDKGSRCNEAHQSKSSMVRNKDSNNSKSTDSDISDNELDGLTSARQLTVRLQTSRPAESMRFPNPSPPAECLVSPTISRTHHVQRLVESSYETIYDDLLKSMTKQHQDDPDDATK